LKTHRRREKVMKKLLTVLVTLLMVVSIFAAEKPFTLGPNVSYTGSFSFSLIATEDGVDVSGSLTVDSASLAVSPTSDTQLGATFGLSYTAPLGGVTLSLKSITFSTPYFGTYYSVGKQFVNDYFTGRVYNADGSVKDWNADFKTDYEDSVKFTFPAVAGLELYITDNATEITGTPAYTNWFSDMLLAKYTLSPFTLVGGMYVQGGYYTLGLNAKGSVDLGIIKPSIDVFAGMKDASSASPVTVYGVSVSGSLSPITGLTLSPAFKYTDNLKELVYRSSNIKDGQYVQAGVTYTTTFAPVTLTAKTTPKYNFATSAFTLPLNELSAEVAVAPKTLYVTTTNTDLLDSSESFTLYTEADYTNPMISVMAAAEWEDITEFATYTIQLSCSANVLPALTVAGDYRMEPTQSGYDARFTYVLAENVKLTGFYGTLAADDYGNYTVISPLTWNVALTYSAKF